MNHNLNLAIITLATALTLFGCKKEEYDSSVPYSPAANEVWIQGMAFTPATCTVPVNTTVTWTNKDAAPHNVVSNDNLFNSGDMNKGATFSYRFTTAGSYAYRCTLHEGMTGTVIVQ